MKNKDQINIKLLNSTFSLFLKDYYFHIHPPMKFRIWNVLRKITGYRRLKIPYDYHGWITLDERDLLQREIMQHGYYEPEVWCALASHATDHEILWDIGAHIGSLSIRALLDSRFQEVQCFEPNPSIAEILRVNLSLNKGKSFLHQVALSNAIEISQLFVAPSANTGLSTLEKNIGHGTISVKCVMIDSLIEEQIAPPPTLLKIDVEGWETRVLQGGESLLSHAPPKAIVFETLVDGLGNIQDEALSRLLKHRGYKIKWIRRPSGIVEERENFIAYHFVQTNL